MANKTQMRLQQLTGSLVDLAFSGSQSSAGAASGKVSADLGAVLGNFAGAIGRIQGGTSDFLDRAEGAFNYSGADFNLDTDQAVDIDANGGKLSLDGSAGIDIGVEADVAIDIDADTLDIDASGALTMDSAASVTIAGATGASLGDDTEALAYDGSGNLDLDAVALDIDASGALTMDSAAAVTITGATGASLNDDTEGLAYDGSGNVDFDAVALDIDASGAITMDSAAAVTITGATGASLNDDTEGLAYDGSGNVDFDAVALDIDASGALTMDSASTVAIAGAGGASLGDDTEGLAYDGSGNLDLDAVELDVDASAGITLTSSENAADAIVLDASNASGGIDMNVASTTVVSIDANSVDLAQQLVISAGGMDVSGLTTLRGDLQVLGTTTTVSSSNTEFSDAVLGLNYSGSQTGPNRDVGFILGRDGGNMAFVYDNSASAFVMGATNNNPDDATVAFSSWKDLHLANVQVGSGSSSGAIKSGDNTDAITVSNDAVRVTINDKLRVDGGVIEDSDGDARVTFANGGDTVLARADGTASFTINGANGNGTLEGDLEVQGGKVTLTNGATIDSETAGELILTEDLVKASGDLQVSGNDIKDSGGNVQVKFVEGDYVELPFDLKVTGNQISGSAGMNIKLDDGYTAIMGDLTVIGNQISGSAGMNLELHGSGDVDVVGDLKVKGNDIKDAGGSAAITFDGSANTAVTGILDVDGNIIRDNNDSKIIEFMGGGNGLALSGSSKLVLNVPEIDSSDQNVGWILPVHSDALKFYTSAEDIAFINPSGIELQYGSGGEPNMFSIYDGAASSLMIYTQKGGYGSLTGSHFVADTAGDVGIASYMVLEANDVTGSAGNSMQGGLFFKDGGFDVKTESYSWNQGILFASGSAQYDDFVSEFGANATILSALAEAAGGSAVRDDSVISSQVVAGSKTTLGADLSGVPASAASGRVQVFVNGQLMLSGSSNDYVLVDYGASSNANFQFNIEVDDVVSVLAS